MGIDIKVPDSIDHAIENLTGPLTKAVGNTFGELWFLALGGISRRADLRRAKYAYELEVFKQNTERKINDISVEKRIEFNTQVIMGALTDAQYCVEDETLRTMFENLISSCINKDVSEYAHPSFSGIIRRMSQLDAKNLLMFKERYYYPIANYRLKSRNTSELVLPNIFLGNKEENDLDTQAASITSLISLGLLHADFSVKPDASHYHEFELTETYKLWESYISSPDVHKFLKAITKTKTLMNFGSLTSEYDESQNDIESNIEEITETYEQLINDMPSEITVEKGLLMLTNLGTRFLKACS